MLIWLILACGAIFFGYKMAGGASKGAQITLTTDPVTPRIGLVNFLIEVKDETGKGVDTAKVTYNLNMTTMDMGAQQGGATLQSDGRYMATGRLTMQGPWKVTTKVVLADGKELDKSFGVDVL